MLLTLFIFGHMCPVAKLSKCDFPKSSLDYLGYWFSKNGIEMDPGKVWVILERERPQTRWQSFLGFANLYCQFIPTFAQLALPIMNLPKMKGEAKPRPSQPLNWSLECQAAFKKLKRLFTAEPALKHPDLDESFVIQADASDMAMGGVLLQKNAKGELQTCAYTSCKLSETEWWWAVWEKEAYVIRWALLMWRQFLEGSKILLEVWIDHKNLEALKAPCWGIKPWSPTWEAGILTTILMRSYLLRLSYARTKFYDFFLQLSVHQSHICLQFIQRYFCQKKNTFQNWLHPKSFKNVSLCRLCVHIDCITAVSHSIQLQKAQFLQSVLKKHLSQLQRAIWQFLLISKKRTLAEIRGIVTNLCQFCFKQLKVGAGILYSTFSLARLMSVFPG